MNTHFTAFLAAIFLTSQAFSQMSGNYRKDSIDIRNIREMNLSLDAGEHAVGFIKSPLQNIRVMDIRFDTTQIGHYVSFTNILYPLIRNYKIDFDSGASRSLEKYLSTYFNNSLQDNGNELVIFLKKMAIVKRDTITSNESANRNYGQMNFQADVFLKSGKTYYAAFKIDTAFTEILIVRKKEVVEEMKENLLMPALRLLANKILNTDWEKVLQKKMFDEHVVYENYFRNRFNLPILTQSYKRGVYQSFQEFINNAPSISQFKTVREKSRSVSLVDRNGDYINTLNIFGFNDGERCWIQRGNFCYPLIRTGNSFSFYVTLFPTLKLFFTVDMEKGDLL